MKRQIYSAELERYNANNRGNRSGDCVKRAISLAFDLSYNDISKLLITKMHEKHRDKWNIRSVYDPVILELGGTRHDAPDPVITVDEFADTIETSGSYVILCGEKPGRHSHMVCIRDGKVWDSWDSRNYYVSEYYSVPAGINKSINDSIDKYYMNDIANNYAQPAVSNELLRYMNKKKWSYKYYATDYAVSKYQIVVRAQFALESNDVVPKDRKYEFKVPFVIEPTWTEPEILEYVNKNGKQKTYDRLWAINEQEKKLVDEYQMRNQMQDQKDDSWKEEWLTPAEQKFYNSLPGWFRPLVTWLDIENPGQYKDSYEVAFRKHPQDHIHPDKNTFRFEGYNAQDIRNMINEYKDGFRVEGIDYYYADEY